jgi:hypothetical protein
LADKRKISQKSIVLKWWIAICMVFLGESVFSQISDVEAAYDYSYIQYKNGNYRCALNCINQALKTIEDTDSSFFQHRYNWLLLRAQIFEEQNKVKKTYNAYDKLVIQMFRDRMTNHPLYSHALDKRKHFKPLYYSGVDKRNVGGWAFVSIYYGLRDVNFPTGNFGVELPHLTGGSSLYERKFGSIRRGHVLDFNLIGVYDNYGWYPFKTDLAANTHVFYTFGFDFMLVPPRQEPESGMVFTVNMKIDVGFRYLPFRFMFVESAVRTILFGMSYVDLGAIDFDMHTLPVQVSLNRVEVDYNNFFLGAMPYFKTGFYLKSKSSVISIDFMAGYHFYYIYGTPTRVYGYNNGEYQYTFNALEKGNLRFNSQPVRNNTFSLNGWQLGAGVTLHFN